MPAFGLRPAEELEAIVSYVIHLSIRGETEQDVMSRLIQNKGDKAAFESGDIRTEVYVTATRLLAQWADANHHESIKPGDYTIDDSDKNAVDASVRKGYQLFLGKGGCMACHTDYGRQVPYRYDIWGTLVQPRNLTAGNYRGGRRPIDIYWRIAGGIQPSGMSAGKSLTEAERWDLVNFVQPSLSGHAAGRHSPKRFRPSEATKPVEHALADGPGIHEPIRPLGGSRQGAISVGKGWSIFFGVVLSGTFLIWFASPVFGWWMPENVSTFGGGVDNLFYMILGFTAFFFVLTEVVMVYGLWRYAYRPGEKAVYTHGNHRLEVVWTAIPAVLLLVIAFSQLGVWEQIKSIRSRMPAPDLTVAVKPGEVGMAHALSDRSFHLFVQQRRQGRAAAKQMQARSWAEHPALIDDIHTANELHVWKGATSKVYLQTQDVLHSFTLPNLRLKQDTLPGKTIPMWFQAKKHNCRFVEGEVNGKKTGELMELGGKRDAWEIACQELCGGRHYAMRGRLYVHEDANRSYKAWLDNAPVVGNNLANARNPSVAQSN